MPLVSLQHHADNLKCSSVWPRALFGAARFTVQYVRGVGQDVSPGKCVFLSISKTVRKSMKLWGCFWGWVRDATHGVAAVGALPVGFQAKLGLVREKYLPAGLHAVEASYVSASSLSAFRAAAVRSVRSVKMPLAGPVGVDPAFHIVGTRFRLMRRCLAYRPLEVSRIFRALDLVAHGAPGHGPVHLLLICAAVIGVCQGREAAGLDSCFSSTPWDADGAASAFSERYFLRLGNSKSVLSWRIGREVGVPSFLMFVDLYSCLTLTTCGTERTCC